MKTTKKETKSLKYFIDLNHYQNLMDENEYVFNNELMKTNNEILIKKYKELKNSIIEVIQLLKQN